jgi:hypothetical protein
MTAVDDLIAFLRARLDEDQADARKEDEDFAHTTLLPTYDSEHQHRWNTDRVLAEVDAKRQRIDWCAEVIGKRDLSRYGAPGFLKDDPDALAVTLAVEVLRLEAAPFARHPDYCEEWRPSSR